MGDISQEPSRAARRYSSRWLFFLLDTYVTLKDRSAARSLAPPSI
jgi:hypothetical protein